VYIIRFYRHAIGSSSSKSSRAPSTIKPAVPYSKESLTHPVVVNNPARPYFGILVEAKYAAITSAEKS
jgi:hypothetical protein